MRVASTSSEAKATAAGIVERSDTQQRVIPESRRADGSIRKERKVRPGFTPVEDVQRYRPVRAKEAEEARRRGVPGCAAPEGSMNSSPSSSETSSSPVSSHLQKAEADRMTWRSAATGSAAATSSRTATATPPRGNFAPLEPARKTADHSSRTGLAVNSEAPSSEAKSWRNSRLRKPLPPKQDEPQAVPDAWDEEDDGRDRNTDKASEQKTRERAVQTSADDLAAELDGLQINSSSSSSSSSSNDKPRKVD